MNPETKQILRSLLADARSEEPSRHAAVLASVETASVLEKLDTEADYQNAHTFRLRVAQVTEALARNPAKSAIQAFVALTTSEAFLAHEERILSLIRTSVFIRPAPLALATFWDKYSQPDDGYTPTTIGVLIANGSSPALELFESKMADRDHDDDSKVGWLRSDVLVHRNDYLILQVCERLLSDKLSDELQRELVGVLFDYRPAAWFPPSASKSPPPLTAASNEALDQLVKDAIVALTMVELGDEQRQVVKARMEEAGELRARR
jgi:hypothetical protein